MPHDTRQCEWCGTTYVPARRTSRTCSAVYRGKDNSRQTNIKNRKPKVSAPCVVCGEMFVRPRSDSTYCSKTCHRRLLNARQNAVYVPKRARRADCACEVCGTLFSPVRSDARRCSQACNNLAKYADPEHRAARVVAAREWSQANRERRRVIAQNYKRKRREWEQASPSAGITARDWLRTLNRWGHRCAYCGAAGLLHMDHVVPLSRGGAHTIGNVLPACQGCNLSKHNRCLTEWQMRKARREGARHGTGSQTRRWAGLEAPQVLDSGRGPGQVGSQPDAIPHAAGPPRQVHATSCG